MVYINEMLGATFHKRKCMKALKPELISLQEFKRFLRFLEPEQCGRNSGISQVLMMLRSIMNL